MRDANDPWLPDYVARWYDDFREGDPYEGLDSWRLGGGVVTETYAPGLRGNPHVTAAELDVFIHGYSYFMTEAERRFHALRVASSVFQEMGFRFPRRFDEGWRSMRSLWLRSGNLLRDREGYLLPRELRPYEWAWTFEPAAHTFEDYFRGFVRWRPTDHLNLALKVVVLPTNSSPSLGNQLKVGVIPLVALMDDLRVETNDADPNTPRFSVRLNSPAVIGRAALDVLEKCAEGNCDIVVFPELCLTQEIQREIGERLRTLPGGRPWLVVAGSAYAPVTGSAPPSHYNQSVVFDSQGKLIISHHKLHRYNMDVRQQERYGIREALGHIDRLEDMTITPYAIEILDTAAGRLAVLICEDLSATRFVEQLIDKLALDWLLVPVLDGCQMPSRWPAKFGRKYAEKGAAVVVATSLSLAAHHLRNLASPEPAMPGVGVVVIPSTRGSEGKILRSSVHDQPVFVNLPWSGSDIFS
jgi:predicted amidohydrolase